MSDYIPVLNFDELPDNGNKAVEIQGKSILLCRSGNNIYAVANRCSHQAKPLAGGRVRGHCITCPMHGARFDLRTGESLSELTRMPIVVYPVRVIDGRIEIAITR